jgi:hypothetical protein
MSGFSSDNRTDRRQIIRLSAQKPGDGSKVSTIGAISRRSKVSTIGAISRRGTVSTTRHDRQGANDQQGGAISGDGCRQTAPAS